MRADWNAFWAEKSDPKWAERSVEYYRRYAGELRLLYQDHRPSRVLELGCGSGSLYPYLGLEGAHYKGVDFSSAMLDAFRREYSSLSLEQAPAEAYKDETTYDLILSNGLIQYFDPRMLDQHLENARGMMTTNSVLVCGSVPWKARRLGYCRRAFAPEPPRSLARGIATQAKYMLMGDPVGQWYSLGEFRAHARRHGMRARFHGSSVHLYRFHATLTLCA